MGSPNRTSIDGRRLRAERAAQFRSEIIPYLRYVMSGGMLGFTLFGLIAVYAYTEFLKQMPENFPVRLVSALVLAIVVASGSVRSYVKSADTVYLLPAEAGLAGYFRRCLRSAIVLQGVLAAICWLLVWPMYRIGTNAAPGVFLPLFAQLLLLKAVNVYIGWRISQFADPGRRRLFRLMQWPVAFGLLYAAACWPFLWSVPLIGAALIVFLLAVQAVPAHSVNWTYLIELERKQRERIYRFIGAFVDVPREQPSVTDNKLAAGLAGRIPFRSDRAFLLLYTMTWARSELFGITVRLTILGIVVLIAAEGDGLKAALFALFVYLMGMQLYSLRHYHRYSEWLHVYLLEAGLRIRAVREVVRGVHLAVIVLLSAALFATASSWTIAAGLLVAAAVISIAVHRFVLKGE